MVLAFALAVLPPLVLLVWLGARSAVRDHKAVHDGEVVQARAMAQRMRDGLIQRIEAAERACFPNENDLRLLRSRDPRALADLEAVLESVRKGARSIAARSFAFDEDGKVLLPDPRAPFRPDGSAPIEEPDEDRATDAATLEKKRAARALYEEARRLEERDRARAAQLYAKVTDDEDAPPIPRVRAAFRRGDLLEATEPDAAAASFARAALSPFPVRDEKGAPIRPRAALREAAIVEHRDRAEGYRKARDLGLALLAGEHRDLAESEWREAFASVVKLLDAIGAAARGHAEPPGTPDDERPSTGARLVAAREEQLEDRLAWARKLDQDVGAFFRSELVNQRADVMLVHADWRGTPFVAAYKILPEIALDPLESQGMRTKRLLFGVALDLGRITREVLRPECSTDSLEPDESVAVLSASGDVVAYGGPDAVPDASGKLRPTTCIVETVALAPFPWTLELRRPSTRIDKDSQDRLIAFSSLFLLALVATALGGVATFRSVSRSLELARMKQDFVSNVTHELKTPLTSIRMYAETLSLGRARDDEKKKEYLNHIIKESERLQRLIDDILDFARIGEGKQPYVLAEGDVTEVVLEAIDLFRHSATQRGFELYLDLPALGALPPVDLDRDALARSVLNLLSNAVKYSPDNRYVGVSVKREGDMIACAVSDKGIGIDRDDLDRIFDRFFRAGDHMTRAIPGTGLGLSLVDEIVRAHGGQIRVESEKGKGSKFTILLPIVPDYRNVPWPPAASGEAPVVEKDVVPGGGGVA
ncbi:MAG TPA: HAMP domain-containing sensor histidine kinase [Planctomycetota bacterium]|nr:HAMP domain-containing sensor histidine kinase [Planctomycetota bacterium]